MATDEVPFPLIDLSTTELPRLSENDICPRCGGEDTMMGSGLAGGGYGSYKFCNICEAVVEKDLDDSDEG